MPRLHVFLAQLNALPWLQAQLKEDSRIAHACVTDSELLHPGSSRMAPKEETSHDNRRDFSLPSPSQLGECWLPNAWLFSKDCVHEHFTLPLPLTPKQYTPSSKRSRVTQLLGRYHLISVTVSLVFRMLNGTHTGFCQVRGKRFE